MARHTDQPRVFWKRPTRAICHSRSGRANGSGTGPSAFPARLMVQKTTPWEEVNGAERIGNEGSSWRSQAGARAHRTGICANSEVSAQMVCANGLHRWFAQMVCADGLRRWFAQMVCADGLRRWFAQMGCADGLRRWFAQMVCSMDWFVRRHVEVKTTRERAILSRHFQ